ncbi:MULTISPECIES: biopolymer transporter ExbD [unclassified Flavobacterium]|uniref:ExbD/TolR family protein n=1 Tax=unclassified Flavobacterium TaxID=196869 RepID=UPI00086A65D9|nr:MULTISPECIES: biopolymer transporter ExbD [unclassified Flavobacterium]MBN9284385.1 biopolymer transporter ExbD [Flavobacterium sp.]ODS81688.1 MAG: biopolymer transporter ExbD [Chryseobacterium sp. SCN 40-13]OJV72923.1 MAG: biopolymer transporter ExbD [Flavobacterium sp. 40-81]
MAELNTGDGGGKGKKVRSKKQNAGVDLTAMVDLAFLLITFFMLTTSLSKPQSMNLAMPDKTPKDKPQVELTIPDDRSLTILIGKDNKILWFKGQPASPLEGPTAVAFGKDGIRKVILDQIQKVKGIYGADPKKGLIVVIKPSKKSNYKNLVDILDEMAITSVPTYAIVDITPDELKMLDKEGIN